MKLNGHMFDVGPNPDQMKILNGEVSSSTSYLSLLPRDITTFAIPTFFTRSVLFPSERHTRSSSTIVHLHFHGNILPHDHPLPSADALGRTVSSTATMASQINYCLNGPEEEFIEDKLPLKRVEPNKLYQEVRCLACDLIALDSFINQLQIPCLSLSFLDWKKGERAYEPISDPILPRFVKECSLLLKETYFLCKRVKALHSKVLDQFRQYLVLYETYDRSCSTQRASVLQNGFNALDLPGQFLRSFYCLGNNLIEARLESYEDCLESLNLIGYVQTSLSIATLTKWLEENSPAETISSVASAVPKDFKRAQRFF